MPLDRAHPFEASPPGIPRARSDDAASTPTSDTVRIAAAPRRSHRFHGPTLAAAALVAAPIVLVHRHLPASLPILGSLGMTVVWFGWMGVDPRRRVGSLAGVWALVFVLAANGFAWSQHDRVVAQRTIAVGERCRALNVDGRAYRAFRWELARAALGDPLGLEALAVAVRDGEPGWLDADRCLGELGFGGERPPPIPWRRVAFYPSSPTSLVDEVRDGGALGRILTREAAIADYEAALASWRERRASALDFATAPPVFDEGRWRRRRPDDPDAPWPGRSFPWSIPKTPAGLCEAWIAWLDADAEALTRALVQARVGDRSAARATLQLVQRSGDPTEAAIAAFHISALIDASWRHVVELHADRPAVVVDDPGEGAPAWVRTATDAIRVHLEAAATRGRPDELEARLRASLEAVERAREGLLDRRPVPAHPDALALEDLATLLAARLADDEALARLRDDARGRFRYSTRTADRILGLERTLRPIRRWKRPRLR